MHCSSLGVRLWGCETTRQDEAGTFRDISLWLRKKHPKTHVWRMRVGSRARLARASRVTQNEWGGASAALEGRIDVRAETERSEIVSALPKRRLTGWKEIGAFFGKNERTVKRWELQRGLPVHRPPGGANAAVFADVVELEEWLKGSRATAALEEAPEPARAPSAETVIEASPVAAKPVGSRRLSLLAMLGALAIVVAIGALWHRPQESAGHQPPAEAAQLYFSGLYHWNTRTAEGLTQSLGEFRQRSEERRV